MPSLATEPCQITLLKDLTNAGLETAYDARGYELKTCDGLRGLAVDTFVQQQQMLSDWEAQRVKRDKPWWGLGR